MPRSTNATLNSLLKDCQSHSVVDLTPTTGAIKRLVQQDCGEIVLSGNTYTPHLQIVNEFRQTIENAVDRVLVNIQNVDTALGIELDTVLEKYVFARTVIKRLYRGIQNPTTSTIQTIFDGVIVGVETDEFSAAFTIAPDYFAFGNCVAAQSFNGDNWTFPALPPQTPPGDADGSGDVPCFIAGTLISTPEGVKPIEQIEVGDYVFCFCDKKKTRRISEVKELFRHDVERYFEIEFDDFSLFVTPEHFIFTPEGWTLAGELKIGDSVYDQFFQPLEIKNIRVIREATVVYNFEVETFHTYFAQGVAVHNRKLDPIDIP